MEFQFEPVAAGLEFEATLQQETRVLVVDIGGGTTDCSILLMGPQWRNQSDRRASLLGHSGCRVGGNDLDIMLAFKTLMPLLGLGGNTLKGTALPARHGGTRWRLTMCRHKATSTRPPAVSCCAIWCVMPNRAIKLRIC
ncbi:hypothetical protein E05_49950 [Plautia stali symbiont]|nr:hypothetical protein E05_49950 [Plautia stali symbiont]